MDKVALIADIHGNLTALETVLKDIKARGIEHIYCLGDVAIKGLSPDEVTDLIRENCEVVVRGNCDHLLYHNCVVPLQEWTVKHMKQENVEYLGNIPFYHEFYMSGHLVRIFHASPYNTKSIFNPLHSNAENEYANFEISSPMQMFENTKFLGKTEKDPVPDIVGYAHIHSPNIYRFKNKTLFNTGSIGLPIEIDNNDVEDLEDSKFSTVASYMIMEGNLGSKKLAPYSLTLIRLPYNIKKELRKIEKSDIPDKETLIRNIKYALSK